MASDAVPKSQRRERERHNLLDAAMKSASHATRGRRKAVDSSSSHLQILRTATTEYCYDNLAEVHRFHVRLHL